MKEYILRDVRLSLGIDENDSSQDDAIMKMPKKEIFRRICNFNGLINYSNTIKKWIEDIYNIELD